MPALLQIGPRRLWRRHRLGLSVRALMTAVLVVGSLLGWLVHRARVQREAVAAIERCRGEVKYDGEREISTAKHWLATQLERLIGSRGRDYWDYLFDVDAVEVWNEPDRVMEHVAQLRGLRWLSFQSVASNGKVPVADDPRPDYTGAILEKLDGLTGLEGLSFFDVSPPLADADLLHLRGLTALRRLDLGASRRCRVTDAGLVHLEDMTAMWHLNLENHARVTSAGLAHLRGMTRLEHLLISGTQVDDLSPIADLTRLVDLRLDRTRITDAGLSPAAGFTGLRCLCLVGTTISDAGLAHLRNLPRLNVLRLGGTRVTDAGLKHLAGLPSLGCLDLADTAVTDAGLANLAGSPRLGWLHLPGTAVTDAGLVHLANLRLGALNLAGTRVTDAGLKHLAGIGSLTILNLGETRITAAGLQQLAGLNGLKELVVDGNEATNTGIAALQKARPGLKIIVLGQSNAIWSRFPWLPSSH